MSKNTSSSRDNQDRHDAQVAQIALRRASIDDHDQLRDRERRPTAGATDARKRMAAGVGGSARGGRSKVSGRAPPRSSFESALTRSSRSRTRAARSALSTDELDASASSVTGRAIVRCSTPSPARTRAGTRSRRRALAYTPPNRVRPASLRDCTSGRPTLYSI